MEKDNQFPDPVAAILALLDTTIGDAIKEPPPDVAEYLRSDLNIANPAYARTFYNILIIYRDAYGLDNLPLRLLDIIESITILEAGEAEPIQ